MRTVWSILAVLSVVGLMSAAFAQPGEKAEPVGVKPVGGANSANRDILVNPYKELKSGTSFLPPEVTAMQADDFANPGMLTVEHGARLWDKVEGSAKKACAFCHNEAETAMTSVGVRYPAYYKDEKKPISLLKRINLCRLNHMKAPMLAYDSKKLIALSAYVKFYSRGRPVNVKADGNMAPFFNKGRKAYYRRRGQLNISCAQCHEDNVGKKLRGSTLSQGQANGYPAYSLREGAVRTLHQRFQSCNRLVRAEPFSLGSDDYINLEVYLAWRGRGLKVETPAVRD